MQPLHIESALTVTSKVSVRISLERSLPSALARVDGVLRLDLGCEKKAGEFQSLSSFDTVADSLGYFSYLVILSSWPLGGPVYVP